MKTCFKCKEVKDESEFNLDRRRPDGRFPYCKKCRSVSKKPIPAAGNKVCTRCKVEKPFDQFGKRTDREDGLNSWCKECNKLTAKIKRENSPDKVRESGRLSMQKHRATGHNWANENPDRGRWYAHRRRTKKAQNGGEYTIEEWKALCEHYGNKCLACGRTDLQLTFDHVIPLDKGGRNSIENAQPLCLGCNLSKGTRVIDFRPETDQVEFSKIVALLPQKPKGYRKLPSLEILLELRKKMTAKEIAQKYGVKPGAVYKQLQKLGYYSEADLQEKPGQVIRESRPAYVGVTL